MKREMIGIADLTGRTVGSLRVGEMISRYPSPRYKTVCSICGTQGTAAQAAISSGAARCLSAGCGRESIREAIADTPQKAQRKEADAEAAKRRKREEQEAAKLAEAEATLAENASKVARTIRERLATQKDDECFVSPELANARVPREEAISRMVSAFRDFTASSPWFYDTDANRGVVLAYLDRNQLQVVDTATVRHAARRLADFGLLPDERPTPAQAQSKPNPVTVNLTIEREKPERPTGTETETGIDLLTGREREYTRWEVGRMTADDFAKAFGLRRIDYGGSPVRSIR